MGTTKIPKYQFTNSLSIVYHPTRLDA